MAVEDRKRLVTISPWDGTVTTLKDVDDAADFASVRGSFQVKQGARKQSLAQQTRRYGGALVAGESHENDKVTWKALVRGSTTDEVIQNTEAMLLVTERPRWDVFFEFRPSNATASTYYAVRGPAEFDLTYEWAQLAGAQSMYVDVSIPVEPLARGDLATQTISSTTMPAVVSLGTAVGGNAAALTDVALRWSGGTLPPVWCLLAWTKRPGTPLASSVAPFGLIEAETAVDLSTWAAIGTDTDYRGSNGIRCTTSGAGTASASWVVDPSVMQPDEFTAGTIDIEVWARIEIDAAVVSPKFTLSLVPYEGSSFGAVQYDPLDGSAGKLLVNLPSSGVKFRPVRLGVLTMPVDPAQPLKWKVKLDASWAAGSSGVLGVDYLPMVPARARAACRTGVELNSAYPRYVASTGDTNKLIRSDLSGLVAKAAGNFGPDVGMGGEPVELPPGDVDLLVWPSSVVPDDPVESTTEMQEEHTGVTGKLYTWPRFFLARA